MRNFKRSLLIAHCNFKKWIINPRIYIIAILLFCYTHFMENPINNFATNAGIPLRPYILPFFISSGYSSMILLLLVIVLFCDAPFTENEYPYIIIRSGRMKWYWGQQIYIFLASVIYTLLITAMTVIIVSPNLEFGMDWGKIINTFAQTGIAPQHGIVIPFDFSIIQNYTPMRAMAVQILLCSFTFNLIGNVMFLVNSATNRAIGALTATAIVLFQTFAEKNFFRWLYFAPTSWMSLSLLSIDGTGEYPSLIYAFTALVVLNIFLMGISKRIIIRKDIEILKNI